MSRFPLTDREKEIVRLIAHGMTNKEISYELNIQIGSVKSHIHNILKKLALSNRTKLAAFYYAHEK